MTKQCPSCAREWPEECEQHDCMGLFGDCIVCKFGAKVDGRGEGTMDEWDQFIMARDARLAVY